MPDAPPLSTVDYAAMHDFRWSIRRFLRFSEDAAREAGVEPQQHQLLLAVKALPGANVATIADSLQIRHHSAVELIDRTVRANLVERQRSEVDRRQVGVRLTPDGESLLERLSLHHLAELRRAGPALVAALVSAMGDGDSTASMSELQRETEHANA